MKLLANARQAALPAAILLLVVLMVVPIPAAMLGAFLGGIWGTGMLPLLGSLLGAVLGAYAAAAVAEYTKVGDWTLAQEVALSVAKGQFIGAVLKLAAALGMIGVTVYYLFF